MADLRLYSDSRLGTAKTCMRLFYFSYIRKWRSVGTSPALVFGASWSAAMDVIWKYNRELFEDKESRATAIEEAYQAFIIRWTAEGMKHPDELSMDEADDLAPRTPMVALEMLHKYVEQREYLFTDDSFELISIEEPFIVPLDPNDPTLFYAGLTDKKFRYRKSVYGLDHKTSTFYRGTQKAKDYRFADNWIDGWRMSDQVDSYIYEGHQKYGKEFAGVWIDGALVHKTAHDVFKIIPTDKQMPALDAWLWSTHAWIDEIEANKAVLAERSDPSLPYLPAFKQNRKSCVDKWGKCAWFEVCSMHSNPSRLTEPPIGFTEAKPSPLEEKIQKAFGEIGND